MLYRQAVRLLRQVNPDEERVILTFDRAGLVTYISDDRRYFSIILGIVAQLRYNYKIYRQYGKQSAKAQGFLYGVLR